MAITKKGSRTIVVDGIKFLWKLRKTTTMDLECWAGCHVTVQHKDRDGSILQVYFPQHHPTVASRYSLEVVSILPSQVADAINIAIKNGWQPTVPGPIYSISARNT